MKFVFPLYRAKLFFLCGKTKLPKWRLDACCCNVQGVLGFERGAIFEERNFGSSLCGASLGKSWELALVEGMQCMSLSSARACMCMASMSAYFAHCVCSECKTGQKWTWKECLCCILYWKNASVPCCYVSFEKAECTCHLKKQSWGMDCRKECVSRNFRPIVQLIISLPNFDDRQFSSQNP